MQQVIIIGSGFSGLSAACFLARKGLRVTVIEKHAIPGGRARKFEADGFVFDMGPSWYWMPDVFDRFFASFGRQTSDYYALTRLDPSYRVFDAQGILDMPASYSELKEVFEKIEKGSGEKLDAFMDEAAYKYRVGMQKLVHKPGLSVGELLDPAVIAGVFKLQVFSSMRRHVNKFFKNERLRELMEFPILFLGAKAQNTPALYSLMNYADVKLGTWYPMGGMYQIVDAMYSVAKSLQVEFVFNSTATALRTGQGRVTGVEAAERFFPADVVLATADYHFVDQTLLAPAHRNYSPEYWNKRVLAPSCLLYFVGVNKKLSSLQHHNLFFDADFEQHANEIYDEPKWPRDPLFYVSCTSKTDRTAPPGCENLFILIPVSTELTDTPEIRKQYFNTVMDRLEKHCGERIRDAIIYERSYAQSDFKTDYHAYKGNAYGLANTLWQTANLKPSIRNKKLKNLYYAGQLTVPGPGVPPAIISGEVAAGEIVKFLQRGV